MRWSEPCKIQKSNLLNFPRRRTREVSLVLDSMARADQYAVNVLSTALFKGGQRGEPGSEKFATVKIPLQLDVDPGVQPPAPGTLK